MRRLAPLLLALAVLGPPAGAAEAPADTSEVVPDIVYWGLAYRDLPGFDCAGLIAEIPPIAFTDLDWLDLELAAPIEVVRWRGEDRLRVAADPLLALGPMLPLIAVMMYCPDCETVLKPAAFALLPTWLPFVHPTLVVRPVPFAGLTLGWDSACVIGGADKGVTFEPRLGLRLDPHRLVRLEGGVSHGSFWNWRRANERFGWGWYARASLSSDLLGGKTVPRGHD